MYNADIKQSFIKEYSANISIRRSCLTLFNATEKYERAYDSDLCAMKTEDLQHTINEITGIRSNGKRQRVALIANYIKWCIDNNVNGANKSINEITFVNVEKTRKRTVKSPYHMQYYLNSFLDPEDYDSADNVVRCYYWLAYGGVPEEYIGDISIRDVDFGGMRILSHGNEYIIYREGITCFKKCVELTEFSIRHPMYNKVAHKNRLDGEYLLRLTGKTDGVVYLRSLVSSLSKQGVADGKTDIRLSYRNAWFSGAFYRMHELELIGVLMDPQLVFLTDNETRQSTLLSGFKRDYSNWKLTL